MSDQFKHTCTAMRRHLEDGFGYHRQILEQMSVNEIIEAFEKEMANLFNDLDDKKKKNNGDNVMGHYIIKCKECDKVMGQCRCPAKDKEIIYNICEDCKEKEDDKVTQYCLDELAEE